MVFSYGYCWWQNRQKQTNAPRPWAVLMAMAVRQSNTDGIAWCGMSRATPEATGHWHQATTHSVLPQRLPGQQAKLQQSTNTPTKLALSMAIVMWWYDKVCIIRWRWRRSRASLEAMGCHHWASTWSNSINRTCTRRVFPMFFIVKSSKMASKHKDSP